MELFKSPGTWAVLVLLALVVVLYVRSRRSTAHVESGSTLSPAQDDGSWGNTAALPMCAACMSPLVLRSLPGKPQSWTCITPGCEAAEKL